jgi:hypothetical protein
VDALLNAPIRPMAVAAAAPNVKARGEDEQDRDGQHDDRSLDEQEAFQAGSLVDASGESVRLVPNAEDLGSEGKGRRIGQLGDHGEKDKERNKGSCQVGPLRLADG